MAPDIIDLVSSSPPRRDLDPLASLATSDEPPAKRPRPSLARELSRNIEFLSDDFASSDDLDDLLTANGGNTQPSQKKRQRTASIESDHAVPPSLASHEQLESAALPPLRKTPAAQPGLSIIEDPIELTSSLEPNPTSHSRPSVATVHTRRAPIHRASSVTDPFVSSPLPPAINRNHTVANSGPDLPSDPFISSSPVKTAPVAKPSSPTRTHHQFGQPARTTAAAWDPIPSSAPSPAAPRTKILQRSVSCNAAVITIDESSESSSEDELPAIADFDLSQPATYSVPYASGTTSKARRKPSSAASNKTQEERSRQRGERAAAKEAEKARKRRERERQKEDKQRQRDIAAAIAEVNKARTDKKVSTREMVVAIPSSLESTVTVQLQTLLDGLEVQHEMCEGDISNLIKWRRKVNSRFDDSSGQWVPMPQRVKSEQHVLKVMTAEELVDLAVSETLDEHMSAIRRHCPSEQVILVLQGVTAWTRKNRNIRNRQFASGVRSQGDGASTAGRRRNDAQQEYISEDVVEDALLQLQLEHDVLIHHTAIPLETAQWITTFTQHISTIPYKKQKDEATSTARFCMESGQVKTGDDNHDTYVKMLQEIFRVTAPIAYGVAAEFNSVTKLVEGLEKAGPNTLADIRKSANRDGAQSDRTIGQAVSKRLYKVFTGRDETSTDV
ncbi:hypothetical protein K4F52_005244 [Lecanicillium sp. MT-2017a]|nr:hypothetical protein K4F52_005244 [Lecanicillium sp. MT-2017a]